MSSSFYPDHDQPRSLAHSHWLITDGNPLPPVQSVISTLQHYAQALRQPLPPHSRTYTSWWVEADKFAKAIFLLLAYFGYEDPIFDTDSQPDSKKYRRFQIDTAALNSATGSQWPTWSGWLEAVKASRRRMMSYCQKNLPSGMPTPDWYSIIWEQGRSVRQSHGYRLRPLPQYQGYTQYDGFVRSLEKNPARLTLADEWVERLARSSVLLDLLHAGALSSDGTLWKVGEVRLDRPGIALYLEYVVRSSEYHAFLDHEVAFWIQPLLRRAVTLREQRNVVQSPFMYGRLERGDRSWMKAALEVSLNSRGDRLCISNLLEYQHTARTYAVGSSGQNEEESTNIVNQHSRRLVENRPVIEELMDLLETTMASASNDSSVPVSLPVDRDVFILTYASSRLARNPRPVEGVDNDDRRIESNNDVVLEIDDETARQEAVEVDVGELGLDGDDDNKIEAAMNTGTEPSDAQEAQSMWQAAIRSDVEHFCRYDSTRLYRVFMAIMLEISRAPKNEEAREYGRDRRWKRGGSMGIEESNVGLLREVVGALPLVEFEDVPVYSLYH